MSRKQEEVKRNVKGSKTLTVAGYPRQKRRNITVFSQVCGLNAYLKVMNLLQRLQAFSICVSLFHLSVCDLFYLILYVVCFVPAELDLSDALNPQSLRVKFLASKSFRWWACHFVRMIFLIKGLTLVVSRPHANHRILQYHCSPTVSSM